eukprot:6213791-Pleurochrysis_carterae.AAC.3
MQSHVQLDDANHDTTEKVVMLGVCLRMHELADGKDVLHCVAVGRSCIFTFLCASWQQAAGHDSQSVQLCVHASKPLMADFAHAPSDGPFASSMR